MRLIDSRSFVLICDMESPKSFCIDVEERLVGSAKCLFAARLHPNRGAAPKINHSWSDLPLSR
jgi:hypothetical protein